MNYSEKSVHLLELAEAKRYSIRNQFISEDCCYQCSASSFL